MGTLSPNPWNLTLYRWIGQRRERSSMGPMHSAEVLMSSRLKNGRIFGDP